jgi:hypothetical protein
MSSPQLFHNIIDRQRRRKRRRQKRLQKKAEKRRKRGWEEED